MIFIILLQKKEKSRRHGRRLRRHILVKKFRITFRLYVTCPPVTTVKGGHVPLAGAWTQVPPFLSRPAVRREHQPKSEGASATERGRAPFGRDAHTNLLCAVRFSIFLSPFTTAVRHGRRTAWIYFLFSYVFTFIFYYSY